MTVSIVCDTCGGTVYPHAIPGATHDHNDVMADLPTHGAPGLTYTPCDGLRGHETETTDRTTAPLAQVTWPPGNRVQITQARSEHVGRYGTSIGWQTGQPPGTVAVRLDGETNFRTIPASDLEAL